MLPGDEMRQLLESIDTSEIIGFRDRALIVVMATPLRALSAAGTLRVEDYLQQGAAHGLRLYEKGGKRDEMPCHHSLDGYLDAWIEPAGIGGEEATSF